MWLSLLFMSISTLLSRLLQFGLIGKEWENPVGDLAALLPFALLGGLLSEWLYYTRNNAGSYWPRQSNGEGRNVGRAMATVPAQDCLPRANAVYESFHCVIAALHSVCLDSLSAYIFRCCLGGPFPVQRENIYLFRTAALCYCYGSYFCVPRSCTFFLLWFDLGVLAEDFLCVSQSCLKV